MRLQLAGQATVEYGLLIVGICLVILLGAYALGGAVHGWFTALVDHILGTLPSSPH